MLLLSPTVEAHLKKSRKLLETYADEFRIIFDCILRDRSSHEWHLLRVIPTLGSSFHWLQRGSKKVVWSSSQNQSHFGLVRESPCQWSCQKGIGKWVQEAEEVVCWRWQSGGQTFAQTLYSNELLAFLFSHPFLWRQMGQAPTSLLLWNSQRLGPVRTPFR